MSNGLWQRLTLLLALLFSLACCASTTQENAVTDPTASPDMRSLALRIAFTADTKGYYEPCPT